MLTFNAFSQLDKTDDPDEAPDVCDVGLNGKKGVLIFFIN